MRRFTSVTGFLCVFIILLSLLDIGYGDAAMIKKGLISNRDLVVAQLETEEPDQIDVLCVGNSLGFCSVNPMELYKNYGITSYVASTAMQTPLETYYVIQKALKRHPIKVILWEANNIAQGSTDPVWVTSAFLAEEIKYRHPFLRYHNAWCKKVNGFTPRPNFKGYVINEVVQPYIGGEYYNNDGTDAAEIRGEGLYFFDKIKKLCDENHIQLVLYTNPSPLCYRPAQNRGIQKFAKEKGVDYLNGEADVEQIGIDWSRDTYDKGDHLNLDGAKKMTDYIGRYLADEQELEDHRGDAAYRTWNELYTAYEQEAERMKGTAYYRLEEQARK